VGKGGQLFKEVRYNMKDIGSNVIKLEGYGVYVTMLDDKVYISAIDPKTDGPTLDPDKCILWDLMTDPPNQSFLCYVNEKFKTGLVMSDYGKYMSVNEIRWAVKNMREKEK
jgi:hypothetical protein